MTKATINLGITKKDAVKSVKEFQEGLKILSALFGVEMLTSVTVAKAEDLVPDEDLKKVHELVEDVSNVMKKTNEVLDILNK